MAGAAAAVPCAAQTASAPVVPPSAEGGDPSVPLLASAPMLQNPAPTSMGVAFAVSAMANGFVEYSTSPDLKGAVTVKCGGFRVTDMND